MSSPLVSRRVVLAAFAAFAAAALLLVSLASGSASAADVTSGNTTFNLTSGKAGKVSAVKPANVSKRLGKKGAKVTSVAKNGSFAGTVSHKLGGGIRFASGKGKVTVTGLTVKTFAKKSVVSGKLKGKTISVFNAFGKATINMSGKTAKVTGAKLSLTNVAAGKIRTALKLKKAPKGKIGTLSYFLKVTSDGPVDPCVADPNAEGCQPEVVDPYLAECGLEASSEIAGTLPVAGPVPTFTGTVESTPNPITWGFRASFRGYFLGTGGTYAGIDGVTINTLPFPGPPPTGFTFPASSSTYAPGSSASATDDRVVINGSGTLVLCHKAHGFRIALSEPTIVVDGTESRLIVSVDTNRTGEWTPAQRVVLASLDTSATSVDFTNAGDTAVWNDVPVSLTEDGSSALRLCDTAEGGPTACEYEAGANMDPISFSVQTSYPEGLCSIDSITGFTTQPGSLVGPAAEPILDSPEEVTGSLDWGIRQGLRGSAMTPRQFNTTANTTLSNPSDMTGVGKYFSWNAASGTYDAGDPGSADDRLVLNGLGSIAICNVNHGYGVVFSDPSVIIDGADSRIVADVAARVGPDWVSGRVDLVEFDSAEADVAESSESIAWTLDDPSVNPPLGEVTLTGAGAAILQVMNGPSPAPPTYFDGTVMQGFVVEVALPEGD